MLGRRVVQFDRIDHGCGKGFYLLRNRCRRGRNARCRGKGRRWLGPRDSTISFAVSSVRTLLIGRISIAIVAPISSASAHTSANASPIFETIALVGPHFAGAFDVAGAKLVRGFEQVLADTVGRDFLLARFKPISEKLHLDVRRCRDRQTSASSPDSRLLWR